MIASKEKANLIVEIMGKFAPYMDKSTDQYQDMGTMITGFGMLVESFSDLPEDKKPAFINFIRQFNQYIEQASANYAELRNFYSFMVVSTNELITEYKNAIGME